MSQRAVPSTTVPAMPPPRGRQLRKKALIGFIAGFCAVLIFHQPVLALLASIEFVSAKAYVMAPTAPMGVPQVLSSAFWGGVWGIVFAWVQSRFPRGAGYWAAAVVFGALALSFVAWFVVAPLKGRPMAAGGDVYRIVTGLLVNGAWGLGTALFYRLATRRG